MVLEGDGYELEILSDMDLGQDNIISIFSELNMRGGKLLMGSLIYRVLFNLRTRHKALLLPNCMKG
jgi:hypothetical protein